MGTPSKRYKCPVCGSPLSREAYETVLHIDEARREELSSVEEALAEERRALALQRKRMAADLEAAARKAAVEARKDNARLREQLNRTREQLARKAAASSQDRQKIERSLSSRIEGKYASRLRRLEEERRKADQRRERDAEGWKRKVDELQRRTEARDQLHFGPEGEEELATVLKRQFPTDDIERRGRGVDVLHRIVDKDEACGVIVYECKRTATWQAAYVKQIKRSMETHGTRWGVLVTRALPSKQNSLCVLDGVIAVAPHIAHHIARILRDVVVELSRSTSSEAGRAAKAEEIYRYLRSDEFLAPMRTVADRVKELRASLERERTTHESWWTARDQGYASIARQWSGVSNRINEILTSKRPSRRGDVLALTS